jgi:hypothetical protein
MDRIWLRGFTYTALYPDPEISVTKRLEWLRRDPAGYLPQPYEQLASSYHEEGHDFASRKVLIAKQWHRRTSQSSGWRRWPALIWSSLLRATIGYGYGPWLALWPAATLFLIGWWLFNFDYRHRLIVPRTDKPPIPTFHSARVHRRPSPPRRQSR